MRQVTTIQTERLLLFPLTAHRLRDYLAGKEPDEYSQPQISSEIMTEALKRAIQMKVKKLDQTPFQSHPWITYWLIQIRSNGFGAGMIGFKGVPDENGQVEIGYGIDPAVQNQGYTTEALQALADWAFQHQGCEKIIAPNTPRSNPASNRVLEKSGFSIIHETKDAVSWALTKKQSPSINE